MALTREEVLHIATLARVGLSEEDVERFRQQLSHILEHFQMLQGLDTEDVPPTAQSVELQNVQRSDEVAPSFPRSEILANAPQEQDGCLRIRAVLE